MSAMSSSLQAESKRNKRASHRDDSHCSQMAHLRCQIQLDSPSHHRLSWEQAGALVGSVSITHPWYSSLRPSPSLSWLTRSRAWLSHKVTLGLMALSLAGSYVLSTLSSDLSSESDSLSDHKALSKPLFPEKLPDPQSPPPLVGFPLPDSSDRDEDLQSLFSESSERSYFLEPRTEPDKRIAIWIESLYREYLELSDQDYQSRIFELYPPGSRLEPVDRRWIFYKLGQHFSKLQSRGSDQVSRGFREQYLFLAVFMKLDHDPLEKIARKTGISYLRVKRACFNIRNYLAEYFNFSSFPSISSASVTPKPNANRQSLTAAQRTERLRKKFRKMSPEELKKRLKNKIPQEMQAQRTPEEFLKTIEKKFSRRNLHFSMHIFLGLEMGLEKNLKYRDYARIHGKHLKVVKQAHKKIKIILSSLSFDQTEPVSWKEFTQEVESAYTQMSQGVASQVRERFFIASEDFEEFMGRVGKKASPVFGSGQKTRRCDALC